MAGTLYVPPDTYYSFGPSLRQKVVPPTERGGGGGGGGGADTASQIQNHFICITTRDPWQVNKTFWFYVTWMNK